jgi:translation initiation factor 6 (eIF-6)
MVAEEEDAAEDKQLDDLVHIQLELGTCNLGLGGNCLYLV